MRPCPTCGKPFSPRDLRKHAAACRSAATVVELTKLYAGALSHAPTVEDQALGEDPRLVPVGR